MNKVLVNAMLKSGKSILEISTKLNSNADVTELADMIKHEKDHVEEFIKVFLHRKKLSPGTKWDSLVILNRKEAAFSLIQIDENGKPVYLDEGFLAFVIKRHVTFMGIMGAHSIIAQNLGNGPWGKFNAYNMAILVMHHFIKEFESYLYSEFADNYAPEFIIEALAVIEESND